MINSVIHGDCLQVLKSMSDNSIDAIICDPPYGLGKVTDLEGLLKAWLSGEDDSKFQTSGFMGKKWDVVPHPGYWKEMLRVLKPGGHLLAFAGTRTQDLMGISIRLGGFEMRDEIQWLYGSGFPKSLDVSKQLDKLAGADREVVGTSANFVLPKLADGKTTLGDYAGKWNITALTTDAAKVYADYGSAIKPSHESIFLARKPLSEKSIAANVLRWGTGGLNLGKCRVDNGNEGWSRKSPNREGYRHKATNFRMLDAMDKSSDKRFPPNLLLSHSLFCVENECDISCPVRALDAQSGVRNNHGISFGAQTTGQHGGLAGSKPNLKPQTDYLRGYEDTGGASRFFPQFRYQDDDVVWMFKYQGKASSSERNEGLDWFPDQTKVFNGQSGKSSKDVKPVEERFTTVTKNIHPTVKSLELMSWLVALVMPPKGIVLDPFAGSGSTLIAAYQLGYDYIGIEQNIDYVELAKARLDAAQAQLRFEMA